MQTRTICNMYISQFVETQIEKAVKEIARPINKQICTSKGKLFLVACMNILKVNSVKTRHMFMARGQNAGQNNKKKM